MSKARDYPSCRTCPYWEPGDIDYGDGTPERFPEEDELADPDEVWGGTGECRRSPPAASPEAFGGPRFVRRLDHGVVWPRTNAIDWCGEHPELMAFMVLRYQRSRKRMKSEEAS